MFTANGIIIIVVVLVLSLISLRVVSDDIFSCAVDRLEGLKRVKRLSIPA
jgi:hypothetical protein